MLTLYNRLVSLSDLLFRIQKILLGLAVAVVVAINFLNVCLRYLAGTSLNFCETLSVVLFMVIVLLGANIAVKRDGEIRIDFTGSLPEGPRRIVHMATDLVSIIVIAVCIYGLWRTVGMVYMRRQRLTPLPLYTYHVYAVMLAGFVLLFIDHLILLLRRILEQKDPSIKLKETKVQ
jgi:TRAP-type C4-dicarboxylate transport system permease small subunit